VCLRMASKEGHLTSQKGVELDVGFVGDGWSTHRCDCVTVIVGL